MAEHPVRLSSPAGKLGRCQIVWLGWSGDMLREATTTSCPDAPIPGTAPGGKAPRGPRASLTDNSLRLGVRQVAGQRGPYRNASNPISYLLSFDSRRAVGKVE